MAGDCTLSPRPVGGSQLRGPKPFPSAPQAPALSRPPSRVVFPPLPFSLGRRPAITQPPTALRGPGQDGRARHQTVTVQHAPTVAMATTPSRQAPRAGPGRAGARAARWWVRPQYAPRSGRCSERLCSEGRGGAGSSQRAPCGGAGPRGGGLEPGGSNVCVLVVSAGGAK